MLDSLLQLLSKDSVLWFFAISGSGLFILQCLLSLLGGDALDQGEGSGELDAGHVKWLSKQAIAGFFMMFGWVGLACTRELSMSSLASLTVALTAGLFTVFVCGLLFKGARRLKSSGTVFRIEDAIGKEATVYQRIPGQGVGKITVSVHQFTHEIDAVSSQAEEIAPFTQVKIINKADDRTAIVSAIHP